MDKNDLECPMTNEDDIPLHRRSNKRAIEDGSHNFEPWSSDEDHMRVGTPPLTSTPRQREGSLRFNNSKDLTCIARLNVGS
ncbi:hypothetical protein TNCV_3844161 [Trichonephila clavipes]|nr:hypothetical protein TNCV_3844161 [Trichonephila clavipes]